jgi:hypothetical protein
MNLLTYFLETVALGVYLIFALVVLIGGPIFVFLILKDIYQTSSERIGLSKKTQVFGLRIIIGGAVLSIVNYFFSKLGIIP